LAYAIFLNQRLWNASMSVSHPLIEVFGTEIVMEHKDTEPASAAMLEGGYVVIRRKHGFAVLRLPVFRFRPAHSDALHLDVWENGINWIRDAGSYSYIGNESTNEFRGTPGHSTVCFDGRDQMPQLGRFLYGAWLRPDKIEWDPAKERLMASYRDFKGARHQREVKFQPHGWIVTDWVDGSFETAAIRWRLAPLLWTLDGNTASSNGIRIRVASGSAISCVLTNGPESRHYMAKETIPILEVICRSVATVTTDIIYNDPPQGGLEQGSREPNAL
jgi:hypothetical protein